MRGWNKETIEEQLKLHKKQNKDDRYNYICEQFNPIWYCWELEKYALQKDKEIERLNNIINELEEYVCAIEYDERFYNETWEIAVRIHNKLKELKESDNNE